MPFAWGDSRWGGVLRIAGVDSNIDANVMELLLDPLPGDRSRRRHVRGGGVRLARLSWWDPFLRELETLAIGLFPAWYRGRGELLTEGPMALRRNGGSACSSRYAWPRAPVISDRSSQRISA